jgi:preprotein translocase subunit SecA
MDYLREGIGLRGYGQRDPLVEYQREGYDMFTAMMDGIKEESVGSLFNLQVQVQENPIVEETAVDGGLSIALEDPEAASPSPPAHDPRGLAPGGSTPGTSAPGGPAPGGSAQGGTPARGGAPADGSAAARGTHARGSARSETSRSGGPRQQGNQQQGNQPQGSQSAQAGQESGLPAGLAPRRPERLSYSAPSEDGGARVETSRGPAGGDKFARAGRNDPCPCGSGKKYKKCHGA